MKDHPAEVTGPLWFGIECEGKYTGKRTAFVEYPVDLKLISDADIEHVFLTEAFGTDQAHWTWLKHLRARLPHEVTFAIGRELSQLAELETVRQEFPFLHVLARVWVQDSTWLSSLAATDEVSVGIPFNLAVFSSFSLARAKDYARDSETKAP